MLFVLLFLVVHHHEQLVLFLFFLINNSFLITYIKKMNLIVDVYMELMHVTDKLYCRLKNPSVWLLRENLPYFTQSVIGAMIVLNPRMKQQ